MEISIRNATTNDSPSITKLSSQLGYPSTYNSVKSRLAQLLKDAQNNCVFIATNGDKLVGWIHGFYTLRIESDPFVEIGGLVVDEKHQGIGVGRTLVEEVIDWARKLKSSHVRVRCNTKRKESHQFYLTIGFTESKEQKIYDIRLD